MDDLNRSVAGPDVAQLEDRRSQGILRGGNVAHGAPR